MHSEQFCRWQQAFRHAMEVERRFYQAALDSARGLEPAPSDALRAELEQAQMHCRSLLGRMLRDFAQESRFLRAGGSSDRITGAPGADRPPPGNEALPEGRLDLGAGQPAPALRAAGSQRSNPG